MDPGCRENDMAGNSRLYHEAAVAASQVNDETMKSPHPHFNNVPIKSEYQHNNLINHSISYGPYNPPFNHVSCHSDALSGNGFNTEWVRFINRVHNINADVENVVNEENTNNGNGQHKSEQNTGDIYNSIPCTSSVANKQHKKRKANTQRANSKSSNKTVCEGHQGHGSNFVKDFDNFSGLVDKNIWEKISSNQNNDLTSNPQQHYAKPLLFRGDKYEEINTSSNSLEVHNSLSQNAAKLYLCPEINCEKTFSSYNNYQIHQRVHSGERPYECNYPGCLKRFTQKGALTIHIRSHTGEKPFQCQASGCDKRFSCNFYYKCHLRVHTGEKPYVCRVDGCTKRFTQKSSLNTHMKSHKVYND